MATKVTVLGAGRVGSAIVRDLARLAEFDVAVLDTSSDALGAFEKLRVRTHQGSAADAATLDNAIREADIVVGAVPGPMGFDTARRVIEAGRALVDISFFEEDAFELDALARENGVVALVDCGVAPGCSNLIVGRHHEELDETERFWCAVGGLPVVRTQPFEYRAPFSPIDVIAEYTRPARFRRDGHDVTMPALTEIEPIEVPGLGTLEAFNTDGLRTLLHTVDAPSMVEKTMRYPGHAERVRLLRDAGFFAEEEIELDGRTVRPVDVANVLLSAQWRFAPAEEDITVMRVEVDGRKGDVRLRHGWELFDRYDAATQTSSMARTTGYTCTAMVRLVAARRWTEPGIAPPEFVGRDAGCFDFVFDHLRERGVRWKHTITEL